MTPNIDETSTTEIQDMTDPENHPLCELRDALLALRGAAVGAPGPSWAEALERLEVLHQSDRAAVNNPTLVSIRRLKPGRFAANLLRSLIVTIEVAILTEPVGHSTEDPSEE